MSLVVKVTTGSKMIHAVLSRDKSIIYIYIFFKEKQVMFG